MDEYDETRKHLNLKPNDELISILLEHDEDQWHPEVFDIVRLILKERRVTPGIQTEPEQFKTDPIEKDPVFKEIFESIDKDVEESLKDHPLKGRIGYCHIFWEKKKKMLWKKYRIDWQTPAEMNPGTLFD